MRPLVVPLALLALALLAPPAHAEALGLPGGRAFEAALGPGGEAVFQIPVEPGEDGALYAKLLPTPGNAVTDGTKANGSVADGTGWRVALRLLREGADPLDLGAYADGTATPLTPVRAGETSTLQATVHAPADALLGGATQRVYLAVALRAGAQEAGGSNGAQMDAARAVTLVVHLSGGLPPPGGELPDVGPLDPGTGATDPPRTDEGSTQTGTAVATVGVSVPAWWLVTTIALLALVAAGVLVLAYAQLARLREQPARVQVPVRPAREETTPRQPDKREPR